MKLRGAWGDVTKFVGAGTLLCCALLLTVLGGWKKHVFVGKARETAGAVRVEGEPGTTKETPRWAEAYGRLPLSFEENVGQTAREVRYVSHGRGYDLFLTAQEAALALRANGHYDLTPLHRAAALRAIREARKAGQLTAIRLRLEGANPNPQMAGLDRLATRVNYFIGNDPQKWHSDVPSFARVKYESVYPGVDLVFYGSQRRLEYDFVVAPGADPKAIQLKIAGAHTMRVNSRGDLVLGVGGGEVTLQKPCIYQQVNGARREIAGNYLVTGDHRVRFTVASYDHGAPLILDPVLNYSTYLGGSASENNPSVGPAAAIAVDASGDAFVTGQTTSIDFPAGTNGGVVTAPNPNSGAVYVAELNPTGTTLLYSTYLAGTTTSPGESGFGIAVDSSGKVYVTGTTFATDFPTTSNALNAGPLTSNVSGTAFVTKLDPTVSGKSSLLYSTFLGGTGGDSANAIAADSSGNAYIAGITLSTDFPTKNPFQSAPATGNTSGSVFLTRIDTTQSGANSLIYSTYLGGNGANSAGLLFGDQAFGVAVDSAKIAYVSGTTTSTNFPTTATTAFQTAVPAGNTLGAAFVSKIDTTMTVTPPATTTASLIYSTYLAGTTEDIGTAIALGPNNVAYITGTTNSGDYPTTTGAFQTTVAGRAIVSLVDTTLSQAASLKYSTYLGGSGGDIGFGIKADSAGNAYVAGTTSSTDFAGAGTLKTLGAFQPTLLNSFGAAFIAKLNPAGGGASDLLYGTYFSGSNGTDVDHGLGIAIDSASPPNAFLTGETSSTDLPVFPTTAPTAFQTALNGPLDGYVAKLSLIPTLAIVPSSLDFGVQPIGVTSVAQTVTVTNNNSVTVNFTSIAITGTNAADFAKATDTCSPSVAAGAQCTLGITFTPSVAAGEAATLVFTDDDVNSPQNVSLSGTGSASAPGVALAPTSLSFGNQLVGTTSAAMAVTLTNSGTAALTINSFAASGDFAATSTGASACPISPATLAAGANCTINVTFTPTAVGTRNGTLTITDNAGGSPQSIGLSGTGSAPAVLLAPTSLNFGNQVISTTSAPMAVTLTNNGTAALTINSIAASGDFAATSTGATACPTSPATLAAGANCTINVTFTPTAVGARNGTLTITDNAGGSPQAVPLTGNGTSPPDFTLSAAPTTLTVAQGAVGAPVTITVNPANGFSSAVALTCTGAPANSSCVLSPTTITAPTTSTLTFTAHAMVVPLPIAKPTPPLNLLRIVPLFVALMLIFLLRSTQRLRYRVAMVTAILVCVTLAACSGPGSSGPIKTAKGMYPLTVTGTSGALTHNTTVTITVN